MKPIAGTGSCTQCGECVRVCREDSISIGSGEPVVDETRCIDCGDCARACPVEALVLGEVGYTVLAGGKLGRHPQLARTLFDFADERALLAAFETICDIFAGELRPGERLADAVTRLGVDEITRRVGAT